MSIGGSQFYDVFRHYVDDDDSEDNEQVEYYLAKHLGIVRKELIDQDQIWNLKEYNIIQ